MAIKRKRKRRLRLDRLLLLITGCLTIVLLTIAGCFFLFPDRTKDEPVVVDTDITWVLKRFETNNPFVLNPHIMDAVTSEYAVVVDHTSGRTVLDKNSTERMYPASMTKMLTAIVAIEHMSDSDALIEITYDMLAGLYEANASVVGYQIGDTPSFRDLLYGIALPSGADACNAAAITTAGSVDAFVSSMNEKAQEIGMYDSHFCNTTGLHEDDHYTTAADLALLLRYCMDNELFVQVFSTPEYIASPVNSHPYGIVMTSTVFKSNSVYGIEIPGLVGGKTGFTYEAGKCLATWVKVEGKTFIIVTGAAGYDMYGVDNYIDHGFISSQLLTDIRKEACYKP